MKSKGSSELLVNGNLDIVVTLRYGPESCDTLCQEMTVVRFKEATEEEEVGINLADFRAHRFRQARRGPIDIFVAVRAPVFTRLRNKVAVGIVDEIVTEGRYDPTWDPNRARNGVYVFGVVQPLRNDW